MGSLGAPWEAHGKAWDPFGALSAALGASGVLLGSLWGASGATAAGIRGDLGRLGGPRALSEASGSFWAHEGSFRRAWRAYGDPWAGSKETGEFQYTSIDVDI